IACRGIAVVATFTRLQPAVAARIRRLARARRRVAEGVADAARARRATYRPRRVRVARQAIFDLAGGGASVARCRVAVVAALARLQHAVAALARRLAFSGGRVADGVADPARARRTAHRPRGVRVARQTIFDLARGIAAVTGARVTVVAALARLQRAVA